MVYETGNKDADQAIDTLARQFSAPPTREYIREMLTTAVKLHLDGADERDLYLANTTLKELRHIFRIFKRYQKFRKVVIFGSHRSPAKSREYKMAEDFARRITDLGWMVITGGGGGVMEAGNKGAGKRGFAVKIKLPSEFLPNPYVNQGEQLINVKYFFTRKLAFIKESDATVLFPGGFGTHDEAFEVLTLLQTGKDHPRPIILVEAPFGNYWGAWLSFLKRHLLKNKFLTKDSFKLFKIVRSGREAVEQIIRFYCNYHSSRFDREMTVIRLNNRLPEKQLEALSRKYQDIIDGKISPCGPFPAEVRAKECLELPRICFKFDRQNYGRLLELIWDLNR